MVFQSIAQRRFRHLARLFYFLKIRRLVDVLTDPQAIANDFVYKMKYDNGQEATLVRTCLRSERMGTPEFNRGPMLGEHTVSILKEAGYSDEEIEKYLSEGIIRQHD